MKQKYIKHLRKREKKIERRLDPLSKTKAQRPVFCSKRFDYEFSQRVNAISAGGIGVISPDASIRIRSRL